MKEAIRIDQEKLDRLSAIAAEGGVSVEFLLQKGIDDTFQEEADNVVERTLRQP